MTNTEKYSCDASIAGARIGAHHLLHHKPNGILARSTEFRSMSVMCGIDQIKTLGPLRANRLMGCAPGVKTWLKPRAESFCPFGVESHPKDVS
jgi:hypothetical protein